MEKITFKDGSVITAEKNGSCYIVDSAPEFPEDLNNITIEGEVNTTIAHGQLQECASVDGRYWFTILDVPEEVINTKNREAQVMYTALMTDTLMEV
ncbi:MAG: hypothetical protein K6G84_07550 [Lachnospiraceae bacterium]|nr:hypothetical protein [Lachnospiraceae bacterium]